MILNLARLLIVSALVFSSCSMFSAQGRAERRYRNYINKQRGARAKQQSEIKTRTAKQTQEQISIGSQEGPTSVTTSTSEP